MVQFACEFESDEVVCGEGRVGETVKTIRSQFKAAVEGKRGECGMHRGHMRMKQGINNRIFEGRQMIIQVPSPSVILESFEGEDADVLQAATEGIDTRHRKIG